jgi:Galactose oxidase, central domain/Kelch motif
MKTKRHYLFIVHALVALALNLAIAQQVRADFIFTGTLNTNRYGATATLLPNGKVLVAGGVNINGYLSSAELYDPASGTWTNTGSMATPRTAHTATLLTNGQVLVASGANNGGNLFSAELYDPITGTWTNTGALSIARIGYTATLLPNGKVLAAGGNAAGGYVASAELYDPVAGTWANTGSMAASRETHTATLLTNGLVLVTGGANNTGFISSGEIYYPASGTWTNTGSMAIPHGSHTATLLSNGQVLVAGGANSSGYLSSAELYDPVAESWTNTSSMNYTHYGHTAILLPDGVVLVVAGQGTNGTPSSDAELYYPASGTWNETTSPLNIARIQDTATLLTNGQVLVAGGETNFIALGSAEIYTDMGTLKVFLGPSGAVSAGAQWQVDGGAFQNSGVVVSNLLAGFHTISFKNIAGWLAPSNILWTIYSGIGDDFTARNYIINPGVGALQVTIEPVCAVADGAQWQVDSGAWQNSGAVVTNLAAGNHTVSFTNLVGWLTPSNQTVPIVGNITNTATGNYTEASTPGVITWINIGGLGNWSSPTNWDLGHAPNSTNVVLIPNTGGSTCLLDVDATVAGLVIGDCAGLGSDGLSINGHTLAVNGPLTIQSNAIFVVDSGVLTAVSNNLISGVISWTSGTLAGTLTLASNGVLNITGTTFGKNINCVLTNYGTVNWSNDQLNGGGAGTIIYNYGLWNAHDDQGFGGTGTVFNNYGIFRKSGGANVYPGTIFTGGGPSGGGVLFNQAGGVLDVQSGTNGLQLTLQGGANFSGGYVTTNSAGVTALSIGNFNINGTTTCSNVVFGGTSLIGTNVIRGGLTWQNGSWDNAVVTVSSNTILTINSIRSDTPYSIHGCVITNYGVVNWSANAFNGDGGTAIYNYGLWNAQDNQYFAGPGAVFNNYGTFLKSGGAAGYPGTFFTGGGIGDNTTIFNQIGGILSVQTGDVTLGGTYSLTNGTLNFGIINATNNGVLLAGSVLLGGSLSVNMNANYTPAVGDVIGLIGASALTGTFSHVNVPAGMAVVYSGVGVSLNVTGPVPVQILNPKPIGTNLFFQFPTASNQSYTIQQNTNLATTNWIFFTNIVGSGSLFQFQTPITFTPAQSFFRVRQP